LPNVYTFTIELFYLEPQYRSIDERTLIQNCRKGIPSAQKELYDRFCGRMMGVCIRFGQNTDEARDLLQEGFIRVFRKLDQYSFHGSLEGWIRRIVVTTAINYIKKHKERFNLPVEDKSDFAVTPAHNDYNLLHNDVMKAVLNLPLHYRTVINLYAIEGYSHKEVADMLGVNESTCRSQYSRARVMLQKMLEDQQILHKEKINQV
jgi:RNA polymerase sigma factor (sigma-70 family)